MPPKAGSTVVVPLDVAVTTVSGKGRYQRQAELAYDDGYWALRIVGTPGQWTMRTLMFGYPEADDIREAEGVPEHMYIDAGQGWYVENWPQVFSAALKTLFGRM